MIWINYAVIIYLVIINIAAAAVTVKDKKAAKKKKKRISEKTLMLLTVLGGGIGMYLTMLLIRHKTKHIRFMAGIPVIICLEAAAVAALIFFYH